MKNTPLLTAWTMIVVLSSLEFLETHHESVHVHDEIYQSVDVGPQPEYFVSGSLGR